MVLIQVFDCILKNMLFNIILVSMIVVNLDSTMDILEPSKAMWVKVLVDFGKLLIAIGCMSIVQGSRD